VRGYAQSSVAQAEADDQFINHSPSSAGDTQTVNGSFRCPTPASQNIDGEVKLVEKSIENEKPIQQKNSKIIAHTLTGFRQKNNLLLKAQMIKQGKESADLAAV
jgi:hypothetical protein